jgi:hypothetical protein
VRGNLWYWRWYTHNWLSDQHRRYARYGALAFLPHVHVPSTIPAGDGWYCVRCGTRKAIVQTRGRNSPDAVQRRHIRH